MAGRGRQDALSTDPGRTLIHFFGPDFRKPLDQRNAATLIAAFSVHSSASQLSDRFHLIPAIGIDQRVTTRKAFVISGA
jgi:hypothetical protein